MYAALHMRRLACKRTPEKFTFVVIQKVKFILWGNEPYSAVNHQQELEMINDAFSSDDEDEESDDEDEDSDSDGDSDSDSDSDSD